MIKRYNSFSSKQIDKRWSSIKLFREQQCPASLNTVLWLKYLSNILGNNLTIWYDLRRSRKNKRKYFWNVTFGIIIIIFFFVLAVDLSDLLHESLTNNRISVIFVKVSILMTILSRYLNCLIDTIPSVMNLLFSCRNEMFFFMEQNWNKTYVLLTA